MTEIRDMAASLMLITLEVAGAHLLFGSFLERRMKKRWQFNLLVMLQIFGSGYMVYFFDTHPDSVLYGFKLVINIGVWCLFMRVVYIGTVRKIVFLLICTMTIMIPIDAVGMYIDLWIEGGTYTSFEEYMVIALLCKVVELILLLLIGRKFGVRTEDVKLERKVWIQFLFFPIFTVAAASLLLAENDWGRSSILFISIGMILLNLLLYYLLRGYVRSEYEKRELLLQQERIRSQQGLYESIRNSYFEQRARAHEYQQSLETIQKLLAAGKIGEAEQYADETNRKMLSEKKYYNTSNAVIDTIVNAKYRQAAKEGVVMTLKLTDLARLPMGETSFGILLGSLIDGACNTCMRCHKKLLKFYLEHEAEQWDIMIHIPLDNTDDAISAGKIWKEEMLLPQIQKMIEENGGELICGSGTNSLNCHVELRTEEA